MERINIFGMEAMTEIGVCSAVDKAEYRGPEASTTVIRPTKYR